jgi:cytochrome c553
MVLAAALAPVVVRAADPATLAKRGQGAVIACASCHGPRGEGQASFPRLAGMDAGYLRKQLQDFADHERRGAPAGSALHG